MDRAKHFGHQFKLLTNAFEQALNRNSQEFGLTATQAFLLGYVVIHGENPIYAKTLEQEFRLSHATICGILQRLESKEFIRFVPDEADRRLKRIAPTDKALQVQDQAKQRLDAVERQLVRGFTDEELTQFRSFLHRASDNLGVSCHPKQKEESL